MGILIKILEMLITFGGSALGKRAIELGARKLSAATDNGIDDALVKTFLGEAEKDSFNSITSDITNEILGKIIK